MRPPRGTHRSLRPPPGPSAALPLPFFGAPAGALLALLFAGCSGETPASDGGPSTDAHLFSCTTPGASCNAHDSCAINPVCGEDLLCHPERLLDCDDGLDCTKDSCGASGLCHNQAEPGTCALSVKGEGVRCFREGELSPHDPCLRCAAASPTRWSGASGAPCDDGDGCTRDDRCLDGVCQGTSFASTCADGLGCTDDICDGRGGCQNPLKSGFCLIEGACYADQGTDLTGCLECRAAADPRGWSVPASRCTIGGWCFKPGALDATGCGTCDPAADPTGWSPTPGTCFIAGTCLAAGAKDGGGCATCQPAASQTDWTPDAGHCRIQESCFDAGTTSPSGCATCDPGQSAASWSPLPTATAQTMGFEGGLDGFTLDPLQGSVGWQLSTARSRSGSGSLYYGDPGQGSYDSGGANQGAALSPTLTLPAGKKASLGFWLFLDTETSAAHDVLQVKAGATLLWSKDPVTMPPSSYRRWVFVEVDLSALAGQSLALTFHFDTKDAWANSGEGVYLDEVTVISGCAP